MAWQYSDPLNGALLAASNNNTSDFQPFYSSYDPLFSRYQPRSTFFNRQPASINIFDEIDDFELEVETDNILTSARYKVPTNSIYQQPSYVPTQFYSSIGNNLDSFDSVGTDYKNAVSNRNNLAKDSPNPYATAFKPISFDQQSTPPSSFKSGNSYAPSINSSDPNNHNSHHQRLVQYQHRLQQQGDFPSELEALKLKQRQDRLQLLETMKQQDKKYQPIYQEHHIRKQYSETSIPSTNADPLNSNSPTPPLHRGQNNKDKTPRNRNQDGNNSLVNHFSENTQTSNNSNFYYKLSDDQKVPKKYQVIKDKYTSSDYKQYQKNFGFGQNFLPFEAETKQEKIEKAKKRQEYSRIINEQNLKKGSNNNNQLNNQNSRNQTNISNNNISNLNSNVYNSDTFLNNVKHFDISKRSNNFKGKELTRAK